ncbi:uncharacterized protein EKO05_0001836 [Ascochyta rabiei]|uniref:uncharacterized protein n=1 Tax=Didymella rabiei TaxID=5454 RepID=UPI0021FE7D58|nr:uncharacterized protein EKO05_0001836 [Ascochyta rabiei]UPX11216.1 hypothetical protein EKO05_0001836 [Ascochyta rabiei]
MSRTCCAIDLYSEIPKVQLVLEITEGSVGRLKGGQNIKEDRRCPNICVRVVAKVVACS